MTSLTCASDWRAFDGVADRHRDDLDRRLFVVGPVAFAHAVVDGQRAPHMAVREDRDRQERLDLLVLEILAQEAFDVAGLAGEHLALPTFSASRPSSGSELTIDCMITVGGAADADHGFVDPIGGDRLGRALAGQFAQPEQDGAVARQRAAEQFQDVVDLRLPVDRLRASGARSARQRRSGSSCRAPGRCPATWSRYRAEFGSVVAERSGGHAQRSAPSSPGSEKI